MIMAGEYFGKPIQLTKIFSVKSVSYMSQEIANILPAKFVPQTNILCC